MLKVKEEDTIILKETEYIFGESSTDLFNRCMEAAERSGKEPDVKIHIYPSNGGGCGEFFSFSEIKKSLKEQNARGKVVGLNDPIETSWGSK